MEKIVYEATSHLPLVDFDVNGRLKMEGRAIPEDVNRFFDPLIDFASNLEAESVIFDLNLEYFNTSTSKKLLDLLKQLDSNRMIKELAINWHFEEGDDDNLEMGEIYEECLKRARFKFVELAEVS